LKGDVTKFGYLLTGIEVVDSFMNDDKPAAVRKMFDSAIGLKFDAYDNQKKVWGSFTGQK